MSTHSPARDPTRRTVRLLNAVAFSRGLIFLIPVIVPYFADHVGLGFRDFLASEAVFAATMVAMEVPSGWLGDVWGRKRVIVLGGLVAALGAALFLPADSFLDAAVAQALVGVGIALYSGADSALLYDCLAAHGREGRFRRLEGRRHGLGLYAVALSSVVGAGLYAIDPAWPVWGMVAAYLATAGFALAIVEPPRVRQARRWATPDLRSLWASHRGVLAVIAAGAVLFAATSVGMWSQQPYYAHLGIGERWFGLLMAAGYLAGG
ncbi:MAG: MFS transporter, partial [Alphaproteobacteria bacterium]|nr:MFS transporter [Alphaproteobacteria bacterium]